MKLLLNLLLLFAAIFWSQNSWAQDIPVNLTPLHYEADENGVNITNATTQFEGPVLQVPAAPHLRFDRVQNAAPYMIDNYSWSQATVGRTDSISIHTGAASSTAIQCRDNGDLCWDPADGGSSFFLPGDFRRSGDGAYFKFDLIHYFNETPGTNRGEVRRFASSISYPDGEKITITYATGTYPNDSGNRTFYKPIKLTSKTGYYINISYVADGSDASVFGWSLVSQAALYGPADSVNPLGRLTYASGTVTDLAGRVYQCTACNTSLGAFLPSRNGSITLPGETTPSLNVVPLVGNNNVIGKVERDGAIYNYTYQNLRLSGSNYLYDSMTVTGPDNQATTYEFGVDPISGTNSPKKITDPLGRITLLTRNPTSQQIVNVTYPEGNGTALTYTNGMVSSSTRSAKTGTGLASLAETLNYNLGCTDLECWRPTWHRDPLGRQSDFVYNGAGQPIEVWSPADASGVRKVTYTTYTLSPLGLSRPTVIRTCGSGATCGTSAELRTEIDYLGETVLPQTRREIDNVTGEVRTTQYTYDAAGRLLMQDNPGPGLADATYARYDILGRKTWEIGAANAQGERQVKRNTYRDSDDKVVTIESGYVTDPNATSLTVVSRVDYSFDSRRNVIREVLSAGGTPYRIVDRSYDLRNRLICEALRMNLSAPPALGSDACLLGPVGASGEQDRITKRTYDAAGQLLKVTKAFGTVDVADDATYTYSANGKQTSMTDARGYKATLVYDGHDRQVAWIFPSKTTVGVSASCNTGAISEVGGVTGPQGAYVAGNDCEKYSYDRNGNRARMMKRDGSLFAFQFDNLNRMTVKTVPERAGLAATHTRDVYYSYDLRGLMTSARFDSAAGQGITTTYDGFGQIRASSVNLDGATRTLRYCYDVSGNRTRLFYPDSSYTAGGSCTASWSNYVGYSYDALNRPTSLDGNGQIELKKYVYDAPGRLLEDWTGNMAWGSTAYYYDPVGRLNGRFRNLFGTASDYVETYALNPASQVVQSVRDNDAYAWTASVNADRTYATNGLNQYTAAGTAAFCYDANGNLTADGSSVYLYDVENRLVEKRAQGTGNSNCAALSYAGTLQASLRYDPMGRLYETDGPLGGKTRYLNDGDALVAEYDGTVANGAMLRRYVHGADGQADDPIAVYQGTSMTNAALWFLHANRQGSIDAVADTVGTPARLFAYDEYGIPQSKSGVALTPANGARFGYTGQAWLPDVGMWYYKARVYSPTLGRFLQTDPIGYEDQVNLYAYVGNDPINFDDPNGEDRRGRGGKQNVGISNEQVASLEARKVEISIRLNKGGLTTQERQALMKEQNAIEQKLKTQTKAIGIRRNNVRLRGLGIFSIFSTLIGLWADANAPTTAQLEQTMVNIDNEISRCNSQLGCSDAAKQGADCGREQCTDEQIEEQLIDQRRRIQNEIAIRCSEDKTCA